MNKKIMIILLAIIVFVSGVVFVLVGLNKHVTVSYVVNGKILNEESIKVNSIIDKPNDPILSGYAFDGWYLNNKKFDFNEKIKEDIVLEARWYKLEEEVLDESVKDDSDTEKDEVNEKKEEIKKENTNVTNDKVIQKYDSNNKENNNQQSDKHIVTYKVSFVVDNKVIKSRTVAKGGKLSIPKTPVKDGYTFKGWYIGNRKVNSNYRVNKNVKIVGQWDKYTYEVVTIDNDDKSVNRGIKLYKNNSLVSANVVYGDYYNYKEYKLGVWSEELKMIKIASYAQFNNSNNIKFGLNNNLVVKANAK